MIDDNIIEMPAEAVTIKKDYKHDDIYVEFA